MFGPYLDVELVDLDEDGFLDLVAGRDYTTNAFDAVEIYKGLGSMVFIPAPADMIEGIVPEPLGPAGGIAIGDVNGDGRPDIGLAMRDMGVMVYAQHRATLDPACAAGTAALDLLAINGLAGGGGRRVDAMAGSPITLSMAQPPTNPNPADFALFGMLGGPTAADTWLSPWGAMCITPVIVAPANPDLFLLASSITGLPGLVPATPAPWSASAVVPVPLRVTLQGIAIVSNQPSNAAAVTNGILLDVF